MREADEFEKESLTSPLPLNPLGERMFIIWENEVRDVRDPGMREADGCNEVLD